MTIEVNNIKIYYETINDTQLNKGHLKEHAVHITFINFSWPRIEKDDIIAIKVIGTALNKPNLPYIIFAKSTWTLIGCPGFNFIFENWCFYLSDWIWSKIPYFGA